MPSFAAPKDQSATKLADNTQPFGRLVNELYIKYVNMSCKTGGIGIDSSKWFKFNIDAELMSPNSAQYNAATVDLIFTKYKASATNKIDIKGFLSCLKEVAVRKNITTEVLLTAIGESPARWPVVMNTPGPAERVAISNPFNGPAPTVAQRRATMSGAIQSTNSTNGADLFSNPLFRSAAAAAAAAAMEAEVKATTRTSATTTSTESAATITDFNATNSSFPETSKNTQSNRRRVTVSIGSSSSLSSFSASAAASSSSFSSQQHPPQSEKSSDPTPGEVQGHEVHEEIVSGQSILPPSLSHVPFSTVSSSSNGLKLSDLFMSYANLSRGGASGGSHPGIDSFKFMKFCIDSKIIDARFNRAAVDLVFARNKSAVSNKIDYKAFVHCLKEAASKKNVPPDALIQAILGIPPQAWPQSIFIAPDDSVPKNRRSSMSGSTVNHQAIMGAVSQEEGSSAPHSVFSFSTAAPNSFPSEPLTHQQAVPPDFSILRDVFMTYANASAGLSKTGVDSSKWMKLCQDAKIIDTRFNKASVDIMFTKFKGSNNKCDWKQFCALLKEVAARLDTPAQRLIEFISQNCASSPGYII